MIRHTFACFLAVMFDSRCARGSGTARASGASFIYEAKSFQESARP